MNQLPLSQWVEITATSNMTLYAVLANTGESQAVKEYYIHDGQRTPYGLYSGTRYADWFSVMPMLVQLDEDSSFLDWVQQTEHKDWGWLARSPFKLEVVAEHLRGLTQVILPSGDEVFFRYWDGEHLLGQMFYLGPEWASVMPAFAFYWINHQYFTVQIPSHTQPQHFPWWNIPQEMIDRLAPQNTKPILSKILQTLEEDYPELYQRYSQSALEAKIKRILSKQQPIDDVLKTVISQLENRR